MTILELALAIYNIGGTTVSIISGIEIALQRFSKTTAKDLFKKSFINAVKQCAPNLAYLTETQNPETVSVDSNTLDDVVTSLKGMDIAPLTSLSKNDKLTKITTLFSKCVILPGHQLVDSDLEKKIQPILEAAIVDFYNQLPLSQEAFNQIVLEFIQNNTDNQADSFNLFRTFLEEFKKARSEVQGRLNAIKEDTAEIKETSQSTLDASLEMLNLMQEFRAQITDSSNRNANTIIADAVATEHQSGIDNARDLLKKGSPRSALNLLEKMKQRIWTDASTNTKFRVLTNMGTAHLVLNEEQEAARLLIEAFKYNCDDEKALSNCALAHFLLGHTEKAADYAKKTLEKNELNIFAYAILVGISEDKETLDEVISKVPDGLRETPQIAQAISEVARQRRNFEQAIKWGEIMVEHGQEDAPNYKAALARILVEQIIADRTAVLTRQLDNSQREQLNRAIELFTEAWNCVDNTEMRTVETDWIIWKCTALDLLGEHTAAIDALNTAIRIEPDNPVLIMRRALLAFKQRQYTCAIADFEKIQSNTETPEAPILLANALLVVDRLGEATTKLIDFLMTDPPVQLREEANRMLIKIYAADGDFHKAREISAAMRESSPTSVLNLVDAAKIAKATGKTDEALSLLEEAYGYARNSQEFQGIMVLADELYIHHEFEKAATLYEKFADTSQNSQWTQRLLDSYYHSGERKKTLEICRTLREKCGPIEKITEMEFLIYNEIGDMNQARAVGEMYVNAFPSDIEMQIRLGVIHLRSNHFEELDRLLETPFDVKNLSLRSCFDLAYLHKIRSKPEGALDIMYEARRAHYEDAEAHLKYIGLFFQVNMELEEDLNPATIEPGTAVGVESYDQTSWYVIENREDADFARREISTHHPIALRLLGKHLNEEVCLAENPLGPEMWKIADIKSKYVYAFQEILRNFSEQFPESKAMWAIRLEDSESTDGSDNMRPLLKLVDMDDEDSIRIKNIYEGTPLPIGAFSNLTGRNFLDTLHLLRSDPDLGVRCSSGNAEEIRQALALLKDGPRKVIVAPISLVTIHGLEAADTVIEAVGRLGISQSTIDELQQIIDERRSMWSKREGMRLGKKDDQYVKCIITPEAAVQSIEYLEGIMKWIDENCDVLPCSPALNMNQLRKRALDDTFQAAFVDSLLIASEPGNLLLSDDELLRSYGKTNLKTDAGISYPVDSVWTQVLLHHCLDRELLEKSEYDRMTIKLICANYYHTFFDADLLMEAAKQSAWRPSEPYSTLVKTLGDQKTDLLSALNVAVDFLYKLWLEPIGRSQQEYLTLGLLGALTFGRGTREILNPLADGIRRRFTLLPFAEQAILSLIQTYAQSHLHNLIHLTSTPPTPATSSQPRTPPEEKRTLMPTATEQVAANGEARMAAAEAQFRQICAARGLNWDTMTEAERENFVDDLVHEDRECSP